MRGRVLRLLCLPCQTYAVPWFAFTTTSINIVIDENVLLLFSFRFLISSVSLFPDLNSACSRPPFPLIKRASLSFRPSSKASEMEAYAIPRFGPIDIAYQASKSPWRATIFLLFSSSTKRHVRGNTFYAFVDAILSTFHICRLYLLSPSAVFSIHWNVCRCSSYN